MITIIMSKCHLHLHNHLTDPEIEHGIQKMFEKTLC